MNKLLDTMQGLALGGLLLGAMLAAGCAVFFALYSPLVWLDLPDVIHDALGAAVVIVAVLTSALVGREIDRFINRPRRRYRQ